MNVKLLKKIQKYILEEPKRLNMTTWGQFFNPKNKQSTSEVCSINSKERVFKTKKSDLPPCGTVGCIAGTAWLLGAPKSEIEEYRIRLSPEFSVVNIPGESEEIARDLLGLTYEQSNRLFYLPKLHDAVHEESEGWPQKFAEQYLKAKTAKGRANAAVRRIDHFIQTEGRE